jgi:hypothetical protein
VSDPGNNPRRPESSYAEPDREDLDRRPLGYWVSRWRDQPAAWHQILAEVAYVAILLLLLPIALLLIYVRFPNVVLDLDSPRYATFATFGYAWLGGTYGGTLFDAKWLYHTVAKGEWNSDRLIWRLIIPFLSGGVALSVIALSVSGLLPLIDASRLRTSPAVLGLSILTGYFSDVALGALARLAHRLFGTLSEPGRAGHSMSSEILSRTQENSTSHDRGNQP